MPSKRQALRQPPPSGMVSRWRERIENTLRKILAKCWIVMMTRLRPSGPKVIVDAPKGEARHLRAVLAGAANTYAYALDTHLPRGLVLVVQRVVYEGRQLNGLLQTFDSANGRHHVVHLALSVNSRSVSEDELLAALRHQLDRVLEDSIGKPVASMPLDLEVPRVRTGASIVELKPTTGQENRRRPDSNQRVEDDAA